MNTKMYSLYHRSNELELEAKCGIFLSHYFLAVPCGEPYVLADAVKYVMHHLHGRIPPDMVAKMYKGVIE
jgi:hypothetical protein